MEQAELGHLRQRFDDEVRRRFPDAPVNRVEVLQYGDDPEIEPGQLLGRVVIDAEGAAADCDTEELAHKLDAFHDAHRDAIRELRKDLNKLPGSVILEFTVSGEPAEGESEEARRKGPRMRMAGPPARLGAVSPDGPLTPVMARVGREDLETLDTLIAAGIATSRAEGVRWALARIRERPAYEQLRARTREIEDLKSQF